MPGFPAFKKEKGTKPRKVATKPIRSGCMTEARNDWGGGGGGGGFSDLICLQGDCWESPLPSITYVNQYSAV